MTGENEMGLRKIIDLTRMISIVLLLLHFYYYCYAAFDEWQLTAKLGERLLMTIRQAGLFNSFHKSKLLALLFLAISLIGAKGSKSEKHNFKMVTAYLVTGLLLYFISRLCLYIKGAERTTIALLYFTITGTGYILILSGGTILTRVIKGSLNNDVFNKANETFPQEERLITNPYSINFPAIYNFRGKQRRSYINYINPRRGLLILGSPGSGKSYFLVENIIRQLSNKGFVQFVFDYKFPELSTLAYNYYLKNKNQYTVPPAFYCVNFTLPIHRINPLFPAQMNDMIDAIEASKTMLLSINKTWVNRQGEFFVESPINLLAATIWFLRKYQDGKYCTLPHAIELLQVRQDVLFSILNSEPEIQTLIDPFIQSFLADNMETIDSQMSSVKIPLGRISSPLLYYVLSGNDFTLDINNPKEPKIFCLGNDPVKADALAPIISLIVDRMNKIINQPGKHKCLTIYDEFARLRATSVLNVIGQGRSNDIICAIALQDYSQLKQVYSREEAETIFNMCGNIACGQVGGETAKLMSDRFPKIMQDRQSISINRNDTSISRSKQLEASIPAATISTLSSGEFVGITADNPDQPIELKAFHSMIQNNHDALRIEKELFQPLPGPEKPVDATVIQDNYLQIKEDVRQMADLVMDELLNDPEREYLVIKK